MPSRHRLYRSVVRLYPADFRHQYGDDLVQHFTDLVTHRGARAAWARTSLDLAITLPRYHLERLVTDSHTNAALYVTVAVLVGAGMASLMVDGPAGMLLVGAAGVIALTQRSALARAIRPPTPGRRRARLVTAAVLAVVAVVSYAVFEVTVGDSWTITDTILALIGTPAMIGAPAFLLAGLLTPRTPREAPTTT